MDFVVRVIGFKPRMDPQPADASPHGTAGPVSRTSVYNDMHASPKRRNSSEC